MKPGVSRVITQSLQEKRMNISFNLRTHLTLKVKGKAIPVIGRGGP
jgi:hypothetical protein